MFLSFVSFGLITCFVQMSVKLFMVFDTPNRKVSHQLLTPKSEGDRSEV